MSIRDEFKERKLRNRKLMRDAKAKAAARKPPKEELDTMARFAPKFEGVQRFYLLIATGMEWRQKTNQRLDATSIGSLAAKWDSHPVKEILDPMNIKGFVDMEGPMGSIALDVTSREFAMVILATNAGEDAKIIRETDYAPLRDFAPNPWYEWAA